MIGDLDVAGMLVVISFLHGQIPGTYPKIHASSHTSVLMFLLAMWDGDGPPCIRDVAVIDGSGGGRGGAGRGGREALDAGGGASPGARRGGDRKSVV